MRKVSYKFATHATPFCLKVLGKAFRESLEQLPSLSSTGSGNRSAQPIREERPSCQLPVPQPMLTTLFGRNEVRQLISLALSLFLLLCLGRNLINFPTRNTKYACKFHLLIYRCLCQGHKHAHTHMGGCAGRGMRELLSENICINTPSNGVSNVGANGANFLP